MQERLLVAAAALARVLMVAAAFGLALGSIGLASVRGFCPDVEDAGALPAGAVTAASSVTLATVVEEPTGGPSVDPDEPAPAPGETGGPDAGQTTAPSDQQTPGDQQTPDGSEQDGPCAGGAPRCLPPMISSILIVGDPLCHDQAGGRLRRILVPSFVGSTVLLAGAWWLRPSRLQELLGSGRADHTA